jgi:serine/threonine protein kinase
MELLNTKIGKYTLTKYIGEGGMASVYEGTHLFLGTKAAVKVLNPILSKNDQFRQRFRNEAAFMASLDHPNITKVLDFEDSDEGLAIVMELLEGSDLSDLVKEKGAMTFEQFKPLFIQILDAFKYAHNQGIVHRDIKPSNIFIDARGTVKILDFGIAKLFGQGNEMTQTGTQMGTPAYMSPEQVIGDKSIDHRSDIYSLGVTLYYALLGRSPYDTENESQFVIFNKIVYESLPLIGHNELDDVIQKATKKDRNERFQDLNELNFEKISISITSHKTQDFILKNESIVEELIEVPRKTEVKNNSEFDFQNLEIYHTDLGFMDWYQAISECNSLDDSWRLPNLQELNYLYENQNNFKGIQSGEYYWSDNIDDDLNVWAKYFYTGYQCRFNKRTKARVRPVRKKTIL